MSLRVMWLLNHSSARKFEVAMLKSIGVRQIFLPKNFPSDVSFRSASVDWSEDANLDIPKADLDILNGADWYNGADADTWKIASRHFDVCFFILQYPGILLQAARHFQGALLWRTYGLERDRNYAIVMDYLTQGRDGRRLIEQAGARFFFAKAYDHLDSVEPAWLQKRNLYLPLGMHDAVPREGWEGKDARIFFICPDIGFNDYYKKIYDEFLATIAELPYAIGGAQPVAVADPAVLGFTPLAVHEENMRQMRVMFYHSTEPNHVHYHPFEAVRAGMPLVFMGGGMLERMGGPGLPGCCATLAEARDKLARILGGDQQLIAAIRSSQHVLLARMQADNLRPAWQEGFARIERSLRLARDEHAARAIAQPARKRPRIAVLLPIGYRGGTLRGAKLLAQALYLGSRQAGEAADVVLLHLDDPALYPPDEFSDLHPGVTRRAFAWKAINADEARRAMHYGGHPGWTPGADRYLVVDDGIRNLCDCDLWFLISDRFSAPLLPLRPRVHMLYDYVQRYVKTMDAGTDRPFLDVVRQAERVFVTTEFTRRDALQYGGLAPNKVVRLPMLAPDFRSAAPPKPAMEPGYFLWTSNAARHKNHDNALKALDLYYREHGGRLDCRITGVGTEELPDGALAGLIAASKPLRKRLRWLGELPERKYRETLAGAAFLWHPATVDNGTFSVVEAAACGVPALSSDYPAMREIDSQFSLNLAWSDNADPKAMARALKDMEQEYAARRGLLPDAECLAQQDVEKLAPAYWEAVRPCL